MSKLYNFILLLSIVSFNFTYGMVGEFKYKPWVQASNNELSKKRICGEFFDGPDVDKRKPTEQEQDWKCFNYALYKTIGNTIPLQLNSLSGTVEFLYRKDHKDHKEIIIFNKRTSSIDIEKFFDQIQGPKESALVLYTDNDKAIHHFAIVIDNVTFESKWGELEVYRHKPFDVPSHYGNNISFWKLKEKFTTTEGKQLLLESIKEDAENFDKEYQQEKDEEWHLIKYLEDLKNEQIFLLYKGITLGLVLGVGGSIIFNHLQK